MKKIFRKIVRSAFLILFFIFSHLQNSFSATSKNLTVFAEPNMVLALTKIAHIYSQKSNITISVNFSSASDLITNIDSGDPVDIFISAHLEWIEKLRQKGLIDIYNIGYIARDQLVLVTLKTNPAIPEELRSKEISFEQAIKILNKSKSTLIIDFKGNSSGKFSRDFIRGSKFSDISLVEKLAEDKSPILNLIKNSNEYYALLLASQISGDNDLKILAAKKDTNIFYQALAIAGDNMESAREFLKFLKSDEAKKIFNQNGFISD